MSVEQMAPARNADMVIPAVNCGADAGYIGAERFGSRAGAVRLIAKDQIGGVSFSTHRLSLVMPAEFLERNIGCKILVLGIQPKTLGVLEPMSRVVESTINRIGILIAAATWVAVEGK